MRDTNASKIIAVGVVKIMDTKTPPATTPPAKLSRCRRVFRYAKLTVLTIVWLCFTVLLAMFKSPKAKSKPEVDTSRTQLHTLNIALGGVVLIMLYTMIMFELVHRTVAALIATAMALGLLALFGEGETMGSIVEMVDVDTLLLLFSMMLYVAVLVPSGLFDYVAVLAFRVSTAMEDANFKNLSVSNL